MKKKVVFFDAGGTLFSPYPSVGIIYSQVAEKYGMRVSAETISESFAREFHKRDGIASLQAHSSERNEKQWWKDLVRDVFSPHTELSRFDEYFDDLHDLFARAEVWRLYPEVIEVLEALKARGLRMGIVSNWDSRLPGICQDMKIDRYFEFILASVVVGSAKPDRGIFDRALELSGVLPEEALHVGDTLENDWAGGKNAGIDVLIVNRHNRDMTPALTIPTLKEILEHI